MKTMMMSPFEIFSIATVLASFGVRGIREIVAFVRKVNKTHKSLILLRKTVNDHTTRIITLENRLNN
jgi:hypothetical protein